MQNNRAMAMKRSMPIKRKTPLRRVSKKRAVQLAKYRKLREAMLAGAWCEFPMKYFPPCLNRAQDLHHVKGRIGDLLLDKNNIMTLCRSHHDWIHSHGREARKMGILK